MKLLLLCWVCFLTVLLQTGCQVNKNGFVHKSESELEQMEKSSLAANELFINGNLVQAEKILKNLAKEKTVSQPLYQLEQLSVLLMGNRQDEALQLMNKIHSNMEMLFDKKLAEKAQSIWHGEVNKVYKGDAYERATFYAFMALTFIQQGNYEDAIRSVKNGLLADADSNKADTINDYALLYYLGFFASQKMGQRDEALEYLRGMNKALQIRGCTDQQFLETQAQKQMKLLDTVKPNVLLVIWTGAPPTVTCLGSYQEQRAIIHGKMLFDSIALSVGTGNYIPVMNNLGDIDFQATTRGGRLMDNILADKAAAKQAMNSMHGILTIVGLYMCYYGILTMPFPPVGLGFLGAGGGCLVLGFTCHIIGSFMNPKADGRYWKNLPGQLYVVPMNLPPGKHSLMLTGFKHSDRISSSLFNIEVPETRDVSVIHLPMMRQGLEYNSVFAKKLEKERELIQPKAASQRMAKEIK